MKIILMITFILGIFGCSSSADKKKQKKIEAIKKICLEQGGTWIEDKKACKLTIEGA